MTSPHSDFLAGIAKAVAAATILGGGTAVLSTSQQTAVLETRQESAESRLDNHIKDEKELRLELLKRLDRFETKLDRALERSP